MEIKPLLKPQKKEKPQRFGVYRVNKKQDHIKHEITKQKHIKRVVEKAIDVYDGDPLLHPYFPGIAKVSPELHEFVMDRANGKCEICGNSNDKLEVHHIAGRKRKAHPNNLIVLGEYCCHKPPLGVEGDPDKNYFVLNIYQQWCQSKGYNEAQTRFLLVEKLVSDFTTGERIVYEKG